MSFRDEEEQYAHYVRNKQAFDREALREARKQPRRRSGVYWSAPHQPAPYPCREPEGPESG